MRRSIALLILVLGVALTTWLRSEVDRIPRDKVLRFEAVAMPPERVLDRYLGPFRLERAWQVKLGIWYRGGYSALVPLPHGRFLAISDSAKYLLFAPPGEPKFQGRYGTLIGGKARDKREVDSESATRDPHTGEIWLGLEYLNAIVRLDRHWTETGRVRPEAMRDWGENTGPEAMVRLADGRFVVLSEGAREWLFPRTHEALLFPGDPVRDPGAAQRFVVDGPDGFVPVDMAQLPDGRVLVLMRTLIWPMPMRFAGRIVIGDPAQIRPGGTWHLTEVARLASSLPVDNFEGIAVTPRADGKLTVWLMSDDNQTVLQRTLLWKLAVDPADLPRP